MASNSKTLAELLNGDVTVTATDIADGAVSTAKIASDAVTVAKVADTVSLGRRNLVINGDMKVAQRGTSQTGITSGNNFLVDRFKFKNTTSGTWTQEQDSDVPTGEGFIYSWKASCTTADTSLDSSSQLRFIYSPEAQDMNHLMYGTANAKTTTLTFWVKSNKTGTYTLSAEGSHGAGRYYQTTYSVSTADTWEKKTITITGDTDTGEDWNDDSSGFFALSWWMAAGSSINGSGFTQDAWGTDADYSELVGGQTVNLADSTSNNFYITGVQLEVGDTATPFEHRSFAEELALCQRYYQRISGTYGSTQGLGTGFGTSNTVTTVDIFPPVKGLLRDQSAISFSASSSFIVNTNAIASAATNITAATYSNNHVRAQLTANSDSGTTNSARLVRFAGLSAFVDWDSEL